MTKTRDKAMGSFQPKVKSFKPEYFSYATLPMKQTTRGASRFDDTRNFCPSEYLLAFPDLGDIAGWSVDDVDKSQAVQRIERLAVQAPQKIVVAELIPCFLQEPCVGKQIPEHLVVGKRHAAAERSGMRVDADKKYPGILVPVSNHAGSAG